MNLCLWPILPRDKEQRDKRRKLRAELCGTCRESWSGNEEDPLKDMMKKQLERREETQKRTESQKLREGKISRRKVWSNVLNTTDR